MNVTSRVSCSRSSLMAFALVAALMATGAEAYNPFGNGDKDSTTLVNKRRAQGPLSTAELAVILLADPPVAELSAKSLSIAYDTTRYEFIPEKSGLLCEFGLNAGCPPPTARYGTFLVSDLPILDFEVGAPLPGAQLTVNHEAQAGVVTVNYQLAQPLSVEGGGDRNWFAFYFEAKTPYNPYQTLVTFFDRPGTYDFTQISASCVSTAGCGSDIPGYGFSLMPVPAPTMELLMSVGAGILGYASWLRSRSRGWPIAAARAARKCRAAQRSSDGKG